MYRMLNGFNSNSASGDDLLISHSCQFADGLSLVSDADLECLSEHTNGSPQASLTAEREDAGDSRELCNTARSTLLRYHTH